MSLHLLRGDIDAFAELLPQALGQASLALGADSDASRHRGLYSMLTLGYLAARAGFPDQAEALLRESGAAANATGFPLQQQLATLVGARLALVRGEPEQALQILQSEAAQSRLLHWQVTRLAALTQLENYPEARQAAGQIAGAGGHAFIESGVGPDLRLLNIADTNLALLAAAELAEVDGDTRAQQEQLRAFESRRPSQHWSAPIRARVAPLRPAEQRAPD